METIQNILTWLNTPENWIIITPILLEILLRLFPTEKNRSIITFIVSKVLPEIFRLALVIIDVVVPNIKKNKTLLIIFFCLFAFNSYGQFNTNTRVVKFNNAQRSSDTTATATHNGWLWFDHSKQHFRYTSEGINKTLGSGGGGGGLTNSAPENALTKSGPDGNLITSGVYSTSDGSIILGSASIPGQRTITTATSSGVNSLTISAGSQPILQGSSTGTNTGLIGNPILIQDGLTPTNSGIQVNFTTREFSFNNAVTPTAWNVYGPGGNVTFNNGASLSVSGGDAYQTAGNGNGGNLILSGGDPRGSGTRGDVVFIITRTDCTGATSGTLWNDAGTLKICP